MGRSAAAIGGGNFVNGAVTGAFSYALNDRLHPPQDEPIRPTASPIDLIVVGAGAALETGATLLGEMFAEEGIIAPELRPKGGQSFTEPQGVNWSKHRLDMSPSRRRMVKVGLAPQRSTLGENSNILRWGEPNPLTRKDIFAICLLPHRVARCDDSLRFGFSDGRRAMRNAGLGWGKAR